MLGLKKKPELPGWHSFSDALDILGCRLMLLERDKNIGMGSSKQKNQKGSNGPGALSLMRKPKY